MRGEASEKDCIYYLRENLHKLSEEVSIVADDLHAGNTAGKKTLQVLKEYIQRISDEISKLDSQGEEEE